MSLSLARAQPSPVLSCHRFGGVSCLSRPRRDMSGEGRSRGGQQRGDWEVGDWVCPSCRAINFKRRSSCLKCGAGKPEAFEQAIPYAPLGGDSKKGSSSSKKSGGSKGDEMWCELCLIECPGQASYTEHCRGKKHRAALRAMADQGTCMPAGNVSKASSEQGKGMHVPDCSGSTPRSSALIRVVQIDG